MIVPFPAAHWEEGPGYGDGFFLNSSRAFLTVLPRWQRKWQDVSQLCHSNNCNFGHTIVTKYEL